MMRFEMHIHAKLNTVEEMEKLKAELYAAVQKPLGMNYETLEVSFIDTMPPTMAGLVLNVFEAIPGHEITMKNVP